MFCPYCGSQLEDGAKFCTNCGNAAYSDAHAKRKFRLAWEKKPINPTLKKRVLTVLAVLILASAIFCIYGYANRHTTITLPDPAVFFDTEHAVAGYYDGDYRFQQDHSEDEIKDALSAYLTLVTSKYGMSISNKWGEYQIDAPCPVLVRELFGWHGIELDSDFCTGIDIEQQGQGKLNFAPAEIYDWNTRSVVDVAS